MNSTQQFRTPRDFYLDWETVSVVLCNTNAIDLPHMTTETIEQANDFLYGYGYDPDDPAQMQELQRLKRDALSFIEKQLLRDPDDPSTRLEILPSIKDERDVRQLMLWASNDRGDMGKWSCSVLRVMHTLTHVSNDLSANFLPTIQKQVLDRVLRHVHTDPSGDVYLGSEDQGIRLFMVDIKTQKSRDSLVLKLLHKEENTSAEIFDRIGFRFVAFTKLEALAVLKFLQENVFAFPNVRSGRSRNTLIHMGQYHLFLDRLMADIRRGLIKECDIYEKVHAFLEAGGAHSEATPEEIHQWNVHSSTSYSSVQITCRQLIRAKGSPLLSAPGVKTRGAVDYKFYFPYEIQILDKDSYIESRRGRASHRDYKLDQLRVARERVFPWLLEDALISRKP